MTEDQLIYSRIKIPVKTCLYEIHVTAMHGDADMYTKDVVRCEGLDDFLSKVQILKEQIALISSSYRYVNSDAYATWVEDQMNWLEIEKEAASDYQYFAQLDRFEMFHYDSQGIKWRITEKKGGPSLDRA